METKYRLTKTHLYHRTIEYAIDENGVEIVPELDDTTEELDPYYTIYELVAGDWEEYDCTFDEDIAIKEYNELLKGEQ